MIQKLRALLVKYRDILTYLLFGVLTTLVNYLVYLPLYNLLGASAAFSNMIAWVAAVIFAYLTNKPFVFRSHDWSGKTLIPELIRFAGCRLASGIAETGILLVCVDLLGWNGNLWKILTGILVVVLNYAASKFFVFRMDTQ